jgi:hypothetical protein
MQTIEKAKLVTAQFFLKISHQTGQRPDMRNWPSLSPYAYAKQDTRRDRIPAKMVASPH